MRFVGEKMLAFAAVAAAPMGAVADAQNAILGQAKTPMTYYSTLQQREPAFKRPVNLVQFLIHAAKILAVALAFSCGSSGGIRAAENPSADEAKIVSITALEAQGKALRTDILSHYHSTKISASNVRIDDVTVLIERRLSPGISFADAEVILRAAGCTVIRPNDPRGEGQLSIRDDVFGKMILEQRFLSVVELWIGLSPSAPNDYRTVAKMVAKISLSQL